MYSTNINDTPQLCCVFGCPNAEDAGTSFRFEIVEVFASHDYTYSWDTGTQRLIRCRNCGALFLQKHFEFKALRYQDDDMYYIYYFAVKDREEALVYNAECNGPAFEMNYGKPLIKRVNTRWEWSKPN